ncbi:MAG: hypothetical protein ACT4RN_13955 [Pseudonocardia sp.]
MTTQFPPRLLLAGAVVTALTASSGTVLTFPTSAPAWESPVPVAAAPVAAAPAPGQGATPVPATPPVVDGAQIAGLAAAPAVPGPPPADPPPDPDRQGMSEADWARLPAGLRQSVRLACAQGQLTGPHCTHA